MEFLEILELRKLLRDRKVIGDKLCDTNRLRNWTQIRGYKEGSLKVLWIGRRSHECTDW